MNEKTVKLFLILLTFALERKALALLCYKCLGCKNPGRSLAHECNVDQICVYGYVVLHNGELLEFFNFFITALSI